MSIGDEFEKLVINKPNSFFVNQRLYNIQNTFNKRKTVAGGKGPNIIELSPNHKMLLDFLEKVTTRPPFSFKSFISGENKTIITSAWRENGDHKSGTALDLIGGDLKMLFDLYKVIVSLVDNDLVKTIIPGIIGLQIGYKDPGVPTNQAQRHIHITCNGTNQKDNVGFERTLPGGAPGIAKEDFMPVRQPLYKNTNTASIDKYNKFLELARKDMNGDTTIVNISGYNFGSSTSESTSSETDKRNGNKYLVMANDAYKNVMDTVFN